MNRHRHAGTAAAMFAAILILTITASAATAQPRRPRRPPRPTPHAGSWEVGGGILWMAGVDFGEQTAELTRNPGTGTGPFALFTTSTTLTSGVGVQGRLAGYLSRSVAVEGTVRYSRPKVEIRVTGDAEGAAEETADETLSQYVFDGSIVVHLTHATFSRGRGVPFVTGGVGYIRDVHSGSELIETGTEYHATGGIKYWFSARPRRFGIRAEGGLSFRDGGFDLNDKVRTLPVVSAGATYIF